MNNKQTSEIVDNIIKVRMKVSAWRGGGKCEQVEDEAATTHGTDADNVSARIKVLGDGWRKPIIDTEREARQFFRSNTLPWEDGGWRVCPVERYQKLCDGMDRLSDELDMAARNLLRNYDIAVEESKARLNGLFNESMFPPYHVLETRFSIKMRRNIVSVADDVRLANMDGDQVQTIRDEIEAQNSANVQAAVASIVEKLKQLCMDAVGRCSDSKRKDGTEIKRRYGSMISQAESICEALKPLVINGDPAIKKLIADTKDAICAADAQVLRDEGDARKEVKTKASKVLDQISSFGI